MKRKNWIPVVVFVFILTGMSCEKQPKCGCDGDMIFELTDRRAEIYYDEDNSSAYFRDSDYGATYSLCNPGAMMDQLKQFEQGESVMVSGEAYNDCTYINSYSYYYGGPGVYMFTMTSIVPDAYSK
jgi:hypothetical protein